VWPSIGVRQSGAKVAALGQPRSIRLPPGKSSPSVFLPVLRPTLSMAASNHVVRVGDSVFGRSTETFHSLRCKPRRSSAPLACVGLYPAGAHQKMPVTDNFRPESIDASSGTLVAQSDEDNGTVQIEFASSSVSEFL
jgi:hypothetical protein